MTDPLSPALSDALDLVHTLAVFSHMADVEASTADLKGIDAGLEALQRWQGAAVDTVGDLLHAQDRLLDALGRASGDGLPTVDVVPEFAWQAERSLDPGVPSHAIRIVLELALDGVPEEAECGGDPERLAGRARILAALARVRRFVALRGDDLDRWLRRTGPTVLATGKPNALTLREPAVPERSLIPRDPALGNVVVFAPRRI